MADIWQITFTRKIFLFLFKSHIQLPRSQHCFRQWLGNIQATSIHLNCWWPSSMMHICITWPHWVYTQYIVKEIRWYHYNDVIMGMMVSQITSLMIVYSTVYSGADQRKHQSSASLAFLWGIQRWPVNSPHKWPVAWKKFPFDDSIISISIQHSASCFCCSNVSHLP